MKAQLYYTVEVRDRDGKLLKRERRKSRSFLKQWNQIICQSAGATLSQSVKDIGGTDRTFAQSVAYLKMNTAADVTTSGIICGKGSTAVTISDFVMASICGQGIDSGKLDYGVCTVGDAAVSGSDCSFTVTRIAVNSSGASITVTEIGMHILISTYTFLGIRDVLASPQAVPDGGAITVVYTIKVTV